MLLNCWNFNQDSGVSICEPAIESTIVGRVRSEVPGEILIIQLYARGPEPPGCLNRSYDIGDDR
jgi:hypothetical protein